MASPSNLFASQAIENKNRTVRIYESGSVRGGQLLAKGYISDDMIPFQTTATYSQFLDENVGTMVGKAGDEVKKLLEKLPWIGEKAGKYAEKASALAQLGVKGLGIAGVKLAMQTVQSWDGTDIPTFNIGLKLVALKADDDPRQYAKVLLGACMPEGATDGKGKVGQALGAVKDFIFSERSPIEAVTPTILMPPNGYYGQASNFVGSFNQMDDSGNGVTGTFDIYIGRWFKATNQLITSANFSMNRVTTKKGCPISIDGQITFKPYKMITCKEYQAYFVDL